jgi:translation initiation factor IF-3
MTQENEHIRILIAARGREIEQRRNAAKTLAQQYVRGDTEYLRENFVKIQDTIEVIESREPRSSPPTPIGFGNR